jgi:hypothetical protein
MRKKKISEKKKDKIKLTPVSNFYLLLYIVKIFNIIK